MRSVIGHRLSLAARTCFEKRGELFRNWFRDGPLVLSLTLAAADVVVLCSETRRREEGLMKDDGNPGPKREKLFDRMFGDSPSDATQSTGPTDPATTENQSEMHRSPAEATQRPAAWQWDTVLYIASGVVATFAILEIYSHAQITQERDVYDLIVHGIRGVGWVGIAILIALWGKAVGRRSQ